MSNSWRRRHRPTQYEITRRRIHDRFTGALRIKDFEKAIEINRRELGLPDYALDSYLTRYGWKPAPTPEDRRVLIAQRYGVPVEWVKLEEELSTERKNKSGLISKPWGNVASSLQTAISYFQHSAITGR